VKYETDGDAAAVPERVEVDADPPAMVSVPGGQIYCTIHGELDCREPFCWRCGNHLMDEHGRCTQPTCRATCTPAALAAVARAREEWDAQNGVTQRGAVSGIGYTADRQPVDPCPVEILTVAVAEALRR
jgi:hypothetical protein